jgi:hypothetical protein
MAFKKGSVTTEPFGHGQSGRNLREAARYSALSLLACSAFGLGPTVLSSAFANTA